MYKTVVLLICSESIPFFWSQHHIFLWGNHSFSTLNDLSGADITPGSRWYNLANKTSSLFPWWLVDPGMGSFHCPVNKRKLFLTLYRKNTLFPLTEVAKLIGSQSRAAGGNRVKSVLRIRLPVERRPREKKTLKVAGHVSLSKSNDPRTFQIQHPLYHEFSIPEVFILIIDMVNRISLLRSYIPWFSHVSLLPF